jgi:hypothetical protein
VSKQITEEIECVSIKVNKEVVVGLGTEMVLSHQPIFLIHA